MTTSTFPLYENLIKNIPKKDLTIQQKEQIIKNINTINDNGKELIFVLIKIYYNKNDSKKNLEIPFNGEKSISNMDDNISTTIKWNFLDFPIPLRHILYNFIEMHMIEQQEENKRINYS